MYNALKYVMFIRTEKHRDGTVVRQHLPVIFAACVMHSDMAERMREQGWNEGRHDRTDVEIEPVSAGFMYIPKMECFGESESLGLKSRKEDTLIIQQWPDNKGMIAE
ncbi:hypothetical protein YOLOSWAG_36 [Erwinia phage vB_EamM_Yoloswag]|uniref:Uncharacterized protein n=1 Tax=Erwinia phage vB_EamM_Yoloswag TaxID=1958956 RepID=A0A1S6L2W4_9CAUD|nr:hypothetical protein HOR66_gp036 [Erwinia phage vB_EamM_Yoloswag]AQT28521.1 hypothetical protein YOLOSWAG_36 [Erwinia phage vB_EamM_Yoloswag]